MGPPLEHKTIVAPQGLYHADDDYHHTIPVEVPVHADNNPQEPERFYTWPPPPPPESNTLPPGQLTRENTARVKVNNEGSLPSEHVAVTPRNGSLPCFLPYYYGQRPILPTHKRQRWKKWFEEFNSPGGVVTEHRRWVRIFGQVGFVAKGVVYGIIGGLTIATATKAPVPEGVVQNASPEGAFILLGSSDIVGVPLLFIMAVGLLFYIVWRFWEACTGQGADATFSSWKNFFKYRLSPFVSGCVYVGYLFYVIFVALKDKFNHTTPNGRGSSCFPGCWQETQAGRVGLGFLGLAFLIATITQLIPAFSGNFRYELRLHKAHRWERILIRIAGQIGFLARAGVFLCVAVLVFRMAKNDDDDEVSNDHSTIGDSINQLIKAPAGRVLMWLLGIGLIVYALYAISNAYYKYFPTRPRHQAFPARPRRRHTSGCPQARASVRLSTDTQRTCIHCHSPPLQAKPSEE
ncbi:hypothetical protein IWQ61_006385 [Dispira simplex]|nr:hypothetical protein IWQ61_006385 [Dispira simplex]